MEILQTNDNFCSIKPKKVPAVSILFKVVDPKKGRYLTISDTRKERQKEQHKGVRLDNEIL